MICRERFLRRVVRIRMQLCRDINLDRPSFRDSGHTSFSRETDMA